MRFIDLGAQQARIREQIEERIRAVLDHGQYIMGPEVGELESALAELTGVKHAIGCGSGTDALLMELMACGIGPGDAVLTTPFTFVATAEVIALLGAVPVFADIDPVTFNIDPGHIERAIEAQSAGKPAWYPLPRADNFESLRIRALITVDLFGLPADHEKIGALGAKHAITVIEDAAQSFGAEQNGKKAGALAPLGCTSFFPAKPLGAYGDGGMCFLGDDRLDGVIRSIRIHGQGKDQYDNVRIGINGRLDTLQAAVLLAKLPLFAEEIRLRQEVAARYADLLGGPDSPVECPVVPEGFLSAWAQYSVLAKNGAERSTLRAKLAQAGIPTAVYYPRPLHLQPAFVQLGYREGDFPASEACANRIFSLPMHPYLEEAQQERIAAVLLSQT